jgi:hypothetical protein
MKGLARWGLPALFGLVCGLAGALVASRAALNRNARTLEVASPPPLVVHDMSGTISAQRQIAEMRDRLGALERGRGQAIAAAGSATPTATAPPDPEESRAAHRREHEAVLERFSHEPFDPRWSQQSREKFEHDLGALAEQNHFKLLSVDCRTTLCQASLEWPDAGAAHSSLMNMVTAVYGLNCVKRIALDDVRDPASPLRGSLVFDCDDLRAGRL